MALAHIIFDLDGTLIDSAPSILDCMATVIDAAGYAPEVPLRVNLIGPPLLKTLERITGITDVTRLQPLAEAFKTRYDTLGLRATQAYPGVPLMLRRLVAAGLTLHLATNKRQRPTRAIIDLFGWDGLFATIYAQDQISPGFADKSAMLRQLLLDNSLDPATCVYIGDIPADARAAASNRLRFVAADWGYGTDQNWDGVEAWQHVSNPGKVPEVLNCGVAFN
jgi:phosphoglycolate phosphatase